MGRRLTAWVWTMIPVSLIGSVAIITLTGAPDSVAVVSLLLQGTALLAVGLPTAALLRADRLKGPAAHGVLILSWRDTRHPQGGGSEIYVERLATRLASDGRPVTIFAAAHENAPRVEERDGVRFVRRGGWRTVYAWAFLYHVLGWLGPHESVIDVQNGVPFFSRLYCHGRVVCLVHHVHRDQWRMNFSRGRARLGWWIESRLAPRVYRGAPYVAVSEATKRDLVALGVHSDSVEVVLNGGDPFVPEGERSPTPVIACLGRLVPHKRIEMVVDAAARLRETFPDLRVVIMGDGPWRDRVRARADGAGINGMLELTGWVDEETKRRLLRQAWILAVPSIMEGWGQNVIEAALCGTPAVAFRVGGLTESIEDGVTGLLLDSPHGFEEALRMILSRADVRERLGAAAAVRAERFSWDVTAARFEVILRDRVTERAEPILAGARVAVDI